MANIVLQKDSPQILNIFAEDLAKNLKDNLNARRTRYRYKSKFNGNSYEAKSVKRYKSGSKRYRATGDLARSISYNIRGFKITLEFNEYGVMLDRGTDGYKLKQIDQGSELYNADMEYNGGSTMSKALNKWIKRRKLKLRLRSRFGVGKKLPNTKANRSKLEFLIKRSLMNRGIAPTMWFTNSYNALKDKLPDDLIFGMINNVDESIEYIFKR